MKYLFKLGHQPEISKAEIFSVFEKKGLWCGVVEQSEDILILSAERIDPQDLMEVLGGTVLIAEQIKTKGKDRVEKIANYLKKSQPEGKIEFGLSGPDGDQLLMPVKDKLKEKGKSCRFVKIKNTASIKYNNLIKEGFHITLHNGKMYVTRAIQPFEKMKEHDYERPSSDPKSGMLPPKLARILINLSQTEKEDKLLDPFCGSGTILMEAASMGYVNLIGSDKSEEAVEASEKNLEWVKHREDLNFNYDLFNQSVERLSDCINRKVDSVITEPFLGEPRTGEEEKNFLLDQINDLRHLYIDSFYEFSKVLHKEGTVVFIIPAFKYKQDWLRIDCIEEIEKTGLKQVGFEHKDYLFYSRPDQLIGREIHKFSFN